MNNNRNNNRRRGRSNRGQGGGNQGNRIDSRARGNAPQLLEKYKKLAHDASLNGDRVQTEYYLQFADHYFRVIADNRVQRDEPRARRDERDHDDGSDDSAEMEAISGRDDRDRGRDSNQRDDRDDRYSDDGEEFRHGHEGEETSQDDDNPFTRDEGRPERNSRGRRSKANGGGDDRQQEAASLDPASLPPSIGVREERGEDADAVEARPRRRTRRPRGDETLEAVG